MGAHLRIARAAWLVVVTALTVTTARSAHGQTPTADLAISETAPAQSNADTDFTVDVTVINNGPDPADSVSLVDPIPTGTTFVSATQNSGTAFTCTPPATTVDPINCTCPNLASGASASFTFVFHIDPGTAPGTYITNVGTVSTTTLDPNSENDNGVATTQTPPPPAADLRVEKTGPSGANPDTDVTYAITLTNGGPGDATNVSLEDTIPPGMVFVSVTQTGGPTLACSGGSGGTVTCTVATFGAGASASLTVVAHIPVGVGAGTTFSNFATVISTYDPTSENDAATTLLCVQDDNCQAGPCNANTAVVCPAPNTCQVQGTCDTVTGECAPNAPKTNGTLCDDANACTQSDGCQAGQCQGAALDCDDGNPCTADACDTTTGCLHAILCEAGVGDASDGSAVVDAPAADDAVPARDAPLGVPEAALRDGPSDSASADVPVAIPSPDAAPDAARDAGADSGAGAMADASVDARGIAADASAEVRAADARIADARGDGPDAEAELPENAPADTGCSCRLATARSSGRAAAFVMLLGLLVTRRRRARRNDTSRARSRVAR